MTALMAKRESSEERETKPWRMSSMVRWKSDEDEDEKSAVDVGGGMLELRRTGTVRILVVADIC